MRRIQIDPTTGCWLFTGALVGGIEEDSYAAIGVGTKADGDRAVVRGHRLSYETFKGPIPEGMVLRHTCDVKRCVNPDHLVPGTTKENCQDAVDRGRMKCGASRRNAIYTDEDIRNIRARAAAGETPTHIAQSYGVAQSGISRIVARKSWKHV